MIDLHTHLDLYPNALTILARVNKENRFTLAVTTSPRAWASTSNVFKGYNNIKVALGLHPEIVDQKFNELELLLSSIHKSQFIGEVGIDGSARYSKTLRKQELIFDSTLRECEKVGGRIISIHSRGAVDKVLTLLKKYPNCGIPILHWFSGSIEQLKLALELGCYFSINPKMFSSSNGQRLVSVIPSERLFPESDGPFAKLNNEPIMPWEAWQVCSKFSVLWQVSEAKVHSIFYSNLTKLLNKTI